MARTSRASVGPLQAKEPSRDRGYIFPETPQSGIASAAAGGTPLSREMNHTTYRSRAASLVGALLRAGLLIASAILLPATASALDKQGSAHEGKTDVSERGFDLSGSLLMGPAFYNPTYAARPDNTGLTLMRYAGHADVDLIGNYLSLPLDVNLFSDRTEGASRALLPTELDVIAGATSTLALGPAALELGMRFEHDMPIDRGGFTQTYGDFRARCLYSLRRSFNRLAELLHDGDVSGFLTFGWFFANPTYAARPDNTGIALFRYAARTEISVYADVLSLGLDATFFTDRHANRVSPSELDLTPEIIFHWSPFELHVAYESDRPLGRSGLIQRFAYVVLVWNLALHGPANQALETSGEILSP